MAYAAVLDPYPHQTKEYNQLYRFYELLREGKLCTTRCVSCGHVTWPPKTVCPRCVSGELEWYALPAEGTVVGYTVAEAGLPANFPVPTIFVLVQLGPVRILARLVETEPAEVEVGMKVTPTFVLVEGTPYAPDRVLPAFRPGERP